MQKYIHLIQSTFTSADTQPFTSKGYGKVSWYFTAMVYFGNGRHSKILLFFKIILVYIYLLFIFSINIFFDWQR